MSSATSGLSVQSGKTRVKRASVLGAYARMLIVAVGAVGCSDGDTGRGTCSDQQTVACMCPGGSSGQRICRGNTYGDGEFSDWVIW